MEDVFGTTGMVFEALLDPWFNFFSVLFMINISYLVLLLF